MGATREHGLVRIRYDGRMMPGRGVLNLCEIWPVQKRMERRMCPQSDRAMSRTGFS